MKNIKSFIYLDEYKMYSFSSQVFKGLTESLIEYSTNENLEQEQQKGPISSGLIMSNIIKKNEGKEEKKYLHDYAYLLFEEKLENDQKVIFIKQNGDNNFDDKRAFIKAKGRVKFTDFKKISNTFKEFNKIGSSLAYVTTYSTQQAIMAEIEASAEAIKDRNEKMRSKSKMESTMKSKINAEIEKMGLHFDDKFLESMEYIIKYGFNDLFLVEMPIQHLSRKINLSCFLNRRYLREEEELLISKYSRMTEKEIVVAGIITQSNFKNDRRIFTINDEQESGNIKQALSALTDKLVDVEDNFVGKMEDEIIIDPIALYLEL